MGGIATYNILGRQVGSHWLAIATLASTAGLATWGMSGGDKNKGQGPQINASSKEEEQFIQEFIRAAEKDEADVKAKH